MVRLLKTVSERLIAALLLIMLFPIMLLLAIMVRLNMGAPVFFKQQRPGKGGELFTMVKYRTMRDELGEDGENLSDERRLSRFGLFLRKTSLDELPELWNVFKGDMSLVGPRPLLKEYLPLYSEYQSRRHEVRPGITGWAQVNGRNAVAWEEKFKLDVWYVEHQSFWLDVKILLMTFKRVILRKGVSAKGGLIMPAFTGNDLSKNEK